MQNSFSAVLCFVIVLVVSALVVYHHMGKIYVMLGLAEQARYICGHNGSRRYCLNVYGEIGPTYTPHNSEKCPKCRIESLRRTVIRCRDCGQPIYPGDEVCADMPRRVFNYHRSKFDYCFKDQYLICGRASCSDESLSRFVGWWDGYRVDLAYLGASPADWLQNGPSWVTRIPRKDDA